VGVRRKAVDYTGIFDGRPEAQNYESPKADKELASELQEWFRKSYEYRQPHERTWELNRLYLKGDQLLARNKVSGEVVRLSTEDSRRLRSNNNILRPTSRSLIGKLSKLIPTYRVLPATSDFDEMEGAKTGEAILQFVRQKEDLDLIYTQLMEFIPWAGNAFAQLVWDKLAGQKIAFCGTCNYYSLDKELIGQPCPACVNQRTMEIETQQATMQAIKAESMAAAMEGLPPGADIRPLEIVKGIPEVPPVPQQQLGPLPPGAEPPPLVEAREGDVRVIIRDPRDVFVPSGTTDLRFASRYCVREVMEISEAARRFPHFAPFLKPDAQVESERGGSYRYQGPGGQGAHEELSDHCFVYEFWERPTEQYEEGRVIYMTNGVIVDEMDAPYADLGRPNLYHFGFDPQCGEFYRDAYITHAWHRQRALNKLETQLDEHIDQVLKMKLLNPLGSRITATEFRSDTGQVIDYNPAAGEPKPLQVPDLPVGVWNRKTDLRQDVQFLASVTEAESGLSVQDPNGRALAIINAEADQQLGPIVHRNNSEWRELHRGILLLYQKFAHADRIATIAGSEGLATVYFGKLFNLKPGWDIRMEQEEGLSRNPAVRLQQAMELAGTGYFLDPMTGMFDKKGFSRYAKLSVPDTGAELEATERAAAAQIPYLIGQGQPWTPRNFDVPTIFKEVLESWLRGPGRKASQEISMQVEMAWAFYTQWAVMQQMGQPGMPQPPPGSGQPGMGGPSQAGSGRSAPGGSPGSPGGVNIASEAQSQVSQADKQGEGMARSMAAGHEN
jgi:hypothetical protein